MFKSSRLFPAILLLILMSSHSIKLLAQGTFGTPLTDRVYNDGSASQVYIYAEAGGLSGVAQTFSFYNNEVIDGRVTPLIFERVSYGHYILRGVGATITPTSAGSQTYPFNLVAGTNIMQSNYTFGFTDREVSYPGGNDITTTATRTGTVDWDYNGGTQWLFTPSLTFEISLGQTFQTGGLLFAAETRSYSAQLTVAAANQAPTNITLTPGSLAENSASGSSVGTLTATDANVGQSHTFSLVAGGPDNASFSISGTSLLLNLVPNFEVKSSYGVRVRADDGNGGTYDKDFTVTITNVNEAPTDISLSASSLAENNAANATIGTLSSSDPDAANTHSYSLVSGAGSTDNAAFNISGSSLRLTASADFETKSSYSLRIRSTDQGGQFFEKAFTVTITNVNETPTDLSLSATSIAENNAANSTVGTLSTSDPDSSDSFTYTLVSGTGSADNASVAIVGNALQLAVSADYETKTSYAVRLRTTDAGGEFYEKAFTVSVTDAPDTSEIAIEQPVGNDIADAGSKNFGFTTVGSQTSLTFTIKNTGVANLTGLTITKDGDNAADFVVTASPVAPVGPSGSTTFTVKFEPLTAGAKTAALHISNNDLDESPFDITLTGYALPQAAHIYEFNNSLADSRGGPSMVSGGGSLTATTYNFGAGFGPNVSNVLTNTQEYSLEMVFRIESIAGLKCLVNFNGRTADPGLYAIDGRLSLYPFSSASAACISAYQTHRLVVTRQASSKVFKVYVDGVERLSVVDTNNLGVASAGSGVLHFFKDNLNDNASGLLDQIRLYDAVLTPSEIAALPVPAADPEIVVEQPSGAPITNKSFGNVPMGTSASLAFTIRNLGTGNLNSLAVSIVGSDSSDFTNLGPAVPTELSPNALATFTVRFTPSAQNYRAAYLRIASNDADESLLDILISGTGVTGLPTVASITPSIDTTLGGSLVTITGTNLGGTSSVVIGGVPATNIVNVNSTTVTAIAGPRSPGIVDVVVTTNLGTGTGASLFRYFTLSPGVVSTTVDTGGAASVGKFASQAIVGGLPAIAYYDVTNKDLYYVRATNVLGTAWGTPVLVDATGDVGSFASMAVVNGVPAIAYREIVSDTAVATASKLKYVRASTTTGATWGAPVVLDAQTGQLSLVDDFLQGAVSLKVISNNPAVAYHEGTNDNGADNMGRNFKYIRATDANGSNWAAPQNITPNGPSQGYFARMEVVNSRPLVVSLQGSQGGMERFRSIDSIGTSWLNGVVTPDQNWGPSGFPLYTGFDLSLGIVSNFPAVSYYEASNADLCFTRASNVDGTTWPAAAGPSGANQVVVDGTDDVGRFSSMLVLNGSPVIAYYDKTNQDLKYVRASAADGSAWATPEILDAAGDVGSHTSIAVIGGGTVGIAYFDATNGALKYTSLSGPEMLVEQPAGTHLADGGSRDFGSILMGQSSSLTFSIKNTGSMDLTGLTFTKDGSAANDFAVTTVPTSPVTGPSGVTTLTVTFSPTAAGARSAALHIASNDTDENPYDILLSGVGVVSNIAPTDITLGQTTLAENNAPYAAIGNLSATDLDAAVGETPQFTLVSGAGDEDNASFYISGASLRLIPSANFEAKNTYNLRVQARDAAGGLYSEALNVTITNVSEPATNITLSGTTISENSAVNTVIGSLTAVGDPDATNNNSFSLVTGVGSADNGLFNISGNDLRISHSPNFEAKSSYSLRVQVSDGFGSIYSKAFTVTVIDVIEAPVISDITDRTINEDASTGLISFTVSSQDALSVLNVSATSSNTALVPNSALVLSGGGGTRYITATPLPNQSGSTTITVSLNVGANTVMDSFVLTVNPVNDIPVAVADAYVTPKGVGRTIPATSLLANDTDVENGALSVASVSSIRGGTALLAGGVVTFIPASNYTGAALFNYTLSDGASGTATGQVTVTVSTSAPVALADGEQLLVTKKTTITNPVTLTPSSSIIASAPLTITGAVTATGTPVINTATKSSVVTISGVVGGAGSLTKIGPGTLNLTAANTFSGGFEANEGTVGIGHNQALGTGTVYLKGATIKSLAQAKTLINQIVIAANTAFDGFNIKLTGAMKVKGQVSITTLADVDLDGDIDDLDAQASGFTKLGDARLNLKGNNTFKGKVSLKKGTLGVGNKNAIGRGPLSLEGGTIDSMADAIDLINDIVFQANSKFTGKNLKLSGKKSLKGNQEMELLSGLTLNGTFKKVGNQSATLKKKGPGKLTASSRSKIDIDIESEEGELVYNSKSKGKFSAKSKTLAALRGAALKAAAKNNKSKTAKLSGKGKATKKTIGRGGLLASGRSPGTLQTTEEFLLEPDSIIEWELSNGLGLAGIHWDHTIVGTTLDITATAAEPVFLDLITLNPDNSPGLAANFNPYLPQTWTLFATGSGINGFDPANFVIDASEFANQLFGGSFSVEVSGNNLNLVYTPAAGPAPDAEIAIEETVGVNLVSGAATVDFGTINPGDTASKTFTVSNLGTNDDLTNLALANAVVTLGGTDVVVNLVASDVSVAPGDSTTFIATITNNQATAAGIAGTFQVLSNDADENPFNIAFTANAASSPVAEIEVVVDSNSSVLSDGVASLNFGSTSSGTPVEIALTVHNAGTLPLTGLGFVIDGAASADFSVFESPDEAIAPGESAPFVIAFEPQGDNVRSAVLHLYSNDADESPFDISLTGTGTLAPEIAVEQGTTELADGSGTAVDFGIISLPTSQDLDFTITNRGAITLSGLALSKTGADAADFVIQSPLSATSLEAGETATFTIRFAPSTDGVKTAALQIASNDADEASFDIALTGEAETAPEISVELAGAEVATDDLIDFGSTPAYTPVSKIFTIKNLGSADLTGLTLTIDGPQSGAYSVSALSNPAPLSGPSGSATFTVTFNPTSGGVSNATVHISNNDRDESLYDINVTGESPAQILLSASSLAENNLAGATVGTLSVNEPGVYTYSLVSGDGDTDNASFSIDSDTLKVTPVTDYETKDTYSLRVQSDDSAGGLLTQVFVIHILDADDTPGLVLEQPVTVTQAEGQMLTLGVVPTSTGNAIRFDGNNDNVAITRNAALNAISSTYTFESWVRVAGYGYGTLISKFEDDGDNRGWMINFGETGVNDKLCVVHSAAGGWVNPIQWNSGWTPALNTWYHVAVVFDASLPSNEIKLYVNGALQAQTSWAYNLVPNNANLYLGGYDGVGNGLNAGANSRFFNGSMDDVRVWNVARTQSQIQADYTRQLTGLESGLVGYWNLNQGTAGGTNTGVTTVTATVGNNGTLVNSALTGTTSNWVQGNVGTALPLATTFTIRNTGDGPLNLTGVNVSGGHAADFTVNTTAMQSTLAPGDTTTFTVTFLNSASGTRTTTLNVLSNDPNNPVYSLLLRADDFVPTDITLTPAAIAEQNASGATVGQLAAVDADLGDDAYTFTLVAGTGDTDNASFSIDGSSLKITPVTDFEIKNAYALRVQVDDGRGGIFSKALTVNITNVNELPTDITFSAAATGEAPAGALVTSLLTNDPDGSFAYFTLVPGDGDTDNAKFFISGTNLYTITGTDYETQNSYSLRVRADDGQGGVYEKALTYYVLDSNEAPSFLKGADIALSAGTTALQTINGWATAMNDGDSAATQSLNFAIFYSSGSSILTGTPTVNPLTGDLSFRPTGVPGTAVVNLYIYDDWSLYGSALASTTQTFRITVGNTGWASAPWTGDATSTISGYPSGAMLWAYRLNSPANISINSYVVQAVTGLNPSVPGRFSLTGMTGSFTGDTNALTALTGTGSASMATSYLNGGNPAFLQLQDLTPGSLYTLSLHGIASSTPGVSDNLFSSGIDSLVVDQNAYGVDKGTVVTYTFIADGPTRNITISPQAASSWNLYGIALRQGSNSPINDISLSNNLIAENSVTNTSIGFFSALDADSGESYTYSLVSGAGDQDNASFNLFGSTLRSTVVADFEAKESYSIRVQADDSNGSSFQKVFTINIRNVNEVPSFAKGADPVLPAGTTSAQTLAGWATNIDDGDSTVIQGLTFTVNVVSGSSLFTTAPAISSTGQLTYTPSGITGTAIMSVTLTDDASIPGYSAMTTAVQLFRISIGNGSWAYAPWTDASVSTLNSTSTLWAHRVGPASASVNGVTIDGMTTMNPSAVGRFSFSGFTSGPTADTNTLTAAGNANGAIAANYISGGAPATLVLESLTQGTTYTLSLFGVGSTDPDARASVFNSSGDSLVIDEQVFGADNGIVVTYTFVAAGSTQTITITPEAATTWNIYGLALRLGANSPISEIVLSPASIAENSPANTVVGTLASTDPDVGQSYNYQLATGAGDEDNASFTITGDTVRLIPSADFETKSTYNFRVRGDDINGSSYFKAFTVTILDVNDVPYNITLDNNTLAENNAANATVGNLTAFDQDSAQTHTFSLVSGTGSADNSSFAIAGNVLKLVPSANFEQKNSYNLRVRATDNGSGLLYFEKAFVVNITDVQENPVDIVGTGGSGTAITSPQLTAKMVFSNNNTPANIAQSDSLLAGNNVLSQFIGPITRVDFADSGTQGRFPGVMPFPGQASIVPIDYFVLQVMGSIYVPTSGQWTFGVRSDDGSRLRIDGVTYLLDDSLHGEQERFVTVTLTAGSHALDFLFFELGGGAQVELFSAPGAHGSYNDAFTLINSTPITIAENVPANSLVTTLTAQDEDAASTFAYTLVSGTGDTDNASFTLASTGELRINNSPDYETKNLYSIRVRATDGTGLEFEKALAVYISNANEAPTAIILGANSISENNAVNATVGSLSSTDVDSPDSHTYSLVSGTGSTDNASFNISGNALRLSVSTNYEAKSSYNLRLRSTDAVGLWVEQAFVVSVLDANDTPHDITLTPASIAENEPVNSLVGALAALDQDPTNTHTFSLVSGTGSTDNASFEVDGSNLKIKVSANFEVKSSYAIRVRTTDDGSPAAFYEEAMTVSITNVNEAPTISDIANRTINEDTSTGLVAFTIGDVDAGTAFQVTGVSSNTTLVPNGNIAFSGTGTSRYLLVSPAADLFGSTDITVTVSDGVLSASDTFTLTVNSSNDAPSFTLSSTELTQIGATPTGGNGYSVGTNGYGQLAAGSGITSTSTVVSMLNINDFTQVQAGDYGGIGLRPDGTVWVWGRNGDGQLANGIVNDSDRSFVPIQVAGLTNVVEVEAGFGWFMVRKNDGTVWTWGRNDLGMLGQGTLGSPSTTPVQVIGLSGVTDIVAGAWTAMALTSAGTVYTWGANMNGQLGRGTVNTHSGTATAIASLSGNVGKIFDTLGYAFFVEKTDGSVWAWGKGDLGGFGDGRSGGGVLSVVTPFQVTNLGTSQVRQLCAGYSFTLAAMMDGSVKVWGDNADGRLGLGYDTGGIHATPVTVPGLANINQVWCVHGSGYALRGDGRVFEWGHQNGFSTDSYNTPQLATGLTNIRQISAGQSFLLAVGNPPSPTIGFTVDEDSAAGSISLLVDSFSPGPVDEAGQAVDFLVTNNNNTLFSTQPAISPTGTLTYALATNANGSAVVSVRGHDNGGTANGGVDTSDPKLFTIVVTPVNDTPTALALSVTTVAENAAINTTVGTLSTTDIDAAESFTYSLVSGSGDEDNASFNISSNNLRTSEIFDFETKSSYNIRVRTTDSGGLFFENSFVVTVTDVNETPTDLALTLASIAENNAVNATVGTLSTTDVDAGNTFTYSLVSGAGCTDNASFSISGSNLRIGFSANFEAKSSYAIRIRTTDQGGLFYEEALTININDVNEVPYEITVAGGVVPENNAPGAAAATFAALDVDAGSSHIFELVSGAGSTDNASFTLAANGALSLNFSTDYETKNIYSIRVRATDNGSLYFEKAFTISVTDVNETPTALALTGSTVNENVALNTAVGTFSSTDVDAANTFTYTLVAGAGDTNNANFNISGNALRANAGIDFEAGATRGIRVRTTDQGGLWFEQVFTITINDVNEMPSFTLSGNDRVPFSTATSQTKAAFVTNINDGDTEVTQTLTFNVTNNNNGIFSVQPAISSTGTLTYTPNGTAGVVTVTVSLTDDNSINGTAALTTATQTFTITVDPSPDYHVVTTPTTLTITNLSNTSDTLSFSNGGTFATFAASGRTFSLNGALNLTGSVDLPYASLPDIELITINAEGGSDTINIGDFGVLSGFPGLTINGGTGDDSVNFNGDISFAENASLDVDLQNDHATPGVDTVFIGSGANLITSSTGAIVMKTSRNIALSVGASVETVNGGITLEANQQATATSGNFSAVYVGGGLVRSTGTGVVTVLGRGGNSGASQIGVYIDAGGDIIGGTTGTLTVTGAGGVSTGNQNYGVQVVGTGSTINSNGAHVIVNGTGGAASSASLHDRGVVVELGGRITSTGIGNVSVTGTGPATGHQQIGVYMGDGSTIDSAGGNVSVTGYGGTGTSGECDGVFMDFGTNLITAGGSGTVTVVGTAGGSATAQGANGVDVRRIGSSIRSSGGNVSVTGTGGTSNTTSLGGNAGVQVMGDGVIAAGGTGTTTVTGIGGTASGIGAEGVVVDGLGFNSNLARIGSANGTTTVTATSGNSSSAALSVGTQFAGRITTNTNNDIIINADSVNIGSNATVSSGTGSTRIKQRSSGTRMNLGGADVLSGSPLTLGLTDAELDRVTAGTINIGDASSGNVTISTALSPANATTFNIVSGGTINDTNSIGTDITVANASTTGGLTINGSSPGTLSVSGNHTLGANSSFNVELGGLNAGTQFDQFIAPGAVNIGSNVTLNVASFGGYLPSVATTYVIINRTGGTGTFAGLPEGGVIATDFLSTGKPGIITYRGGDGDDVMIIAANPNIQIEQPVDNILVEAVSTVDFGTRNIAATSDRTFTVRNTGTSDLTLSSVGISGTHASDFAVTTAPGSTVLAPNATTTFVVTFTPSSNLSRTALLTVASNDLDEANFRINLQGFGNFEPTDILISSATVPENSAAGITVGSLGSVDADVGQTYSYSLVSGAGSADNSFFEIDGAALKILITTDFESKSFYNIRLKTQDNFGGSFEKALVITVLDMNDAPEITINNGAATGSYLVDEHTTFVTTVTSFDIDTPFQHLAYSVSGADAALFVIQTQTGQLSFKVAPDYEAPLDANLDNVYQVNVIVTDDGTPNLSASQALSVIIRDLNDAPVIVSHGGAETVPLSIPENTTAVTTVEAEDEDVPAQTLTYSIVGGADASRFAIDSDTGVLTFINAPDADEPLDQLGDNTYYVTVCVTDDGAENLTDKQEFIVSISNVNEAPTEITISAASLEERNAVNAIVGSFSAEDQDVSQTHSFSLVTGTGSDDNSFFTITGAALSINVSTTYATKSSYSIRVRATDTGSPELSFEKAFTITILPAGSAPLAVTDPATLIAVTTATLNAKVTPNEITSTAWFVYGTDPTLTLDTVTTTAQSVGAGTVPVSTSAAITGLLPETVYYYRVVAQNLKGTSEGTILSFQTSYAIASNMIIPGAPSGDITLLRPLPGPINQAGQISFSGTAKTGVNGITTAKDSILISDVSGGLRVIGQEGTAVPGGGTLVGSYTQQILTEAGQTVTLDRMLNSVTTKDYAYFVSPDGLSLELLSREGDLVTGGGTFMTHTGKPAADANDRLYFQGTLTGVLATKNTGVWYDEAGDLLNLAKEGTDFTSITGDPAWLGNFQAMISAEGDGAAFIAALQNNPDNSTQKTAIASNLGLFSGSPGSLGIIARKGQLIPAVGRLSTFSGLSRSNAGDHAFISLLTISTTAPVVATTNDQVLMAEIGGNLHVVARENTTPIVSTLKPARFGNFQITSEGEVIFLAWLAGSGVTTANDGVLCRWTQAGGIELLAREGSLATGTGLNYGIFQVLSVSPGGAIALQSTLSTGITLMRALPGASLDKVAKNAETVILNGTSRSILTLSIHQTGAGTGGGGGGMGAAINDEGEVFTVLSLSGGFYVGRVYP